MWDQHRFDERADHWAVLSLRFQKNIDEVECFVCERRSFCRP